MGEYFEECKPPAQDRHEEHYTPIPSQPLPATTTFPRKI